MSRTPTPYALAARQLARIIRLQTATLRAADAAARRSAGQSAAEEQSAARRVRRACRIGGAL